MHNLSFEVLNSLGLRSSLVLTCLHLQVLLTSLSAYSTVTANFLFLNINVIWTFPTSVWPPTINNLSAILANKWVHRWGNVDLAWNLVTGEGAYKRAVFRSKPDASWLTMTSCNQKVNEKQPTGVLLTKPVFTIEHPKQTALWWRQKYASLW